MNHQDLRRSFWEQPGATPHYTEQMQDFLDAAADLGFESRFIGEKNWWPVQNEEVAQTLGAHYSDLEAELARLLDGEILRSPMAEFRLLKKRRASHSLRSYAAA